MNPIWITIFFMIIGVSLGWMVGLSQSPVINTVLTSLLGLIAALSFFREKIWQVDKNGAHQSNSKTVKDHTPRYLAFFFFSIAASGTIGLFIKNRCEWFETDYDTVISEYSDSLSIPIPNSAYYESRKIELQLTWELRDVNDSVEHLIKTKRSTDILEYKRQLSALIYKHDSLQLEIEKNRDKIEVGLHNAYLTFNLKKLFFERKYGVVFESPTAVNDSEFLGEEKRINPKNDRGVLRKAIWSVGYNDNGIEVGFIDGYTNTDKLYNGEINYVLNTNDVETFISRMRNSKNELIQKIFKKHSKKLENGDIRDAREELLDESLK